MSGCLEGRQMLVTHAERYIAPPVVELFREEGAHVIADQSDYGDANAVQEVVEQAGREVLFPTPIPGPGIRGN